MNLMNQKSVTEDFTRTLSVKKETNMQKSDQFKDKRQHARFELLEYAIVQRPDKRETLRSVVIDVSLGGLQVRSRHQFDAGQVYILNIGRSDAAPLQITAEARYSVAIEETDLYATGFKCQPNSPTEKVDWVDYVHAIFRAQGESLVG